MFFHNIPLFAALGSWLVAQMIKTVIFLVENRKFNSERLIGAGGMPSAHSASVCALAITVSRVDSVNSTSFAVAFMLAIVVMYDATGVRRAAGLHAKEINRLNRIVADMDEELNDIPEKEVTEDDVIPDEKAKTDGSIINKICDTNDLVNIQQLKEFLGHTPLEVLCGALLGILIGMAIPIGVMIR
ncbi:membrane protein [Clostridia bacterium]|nr:membrane protein [Clostridia bacterium]